MIVLGEEWKRNRQFDFRTSIHYVRVILKSTNEDRIEHKKKQSKILYLYGRWLYICIGDNVYIKNKKKYYSNSIWNNKCKRKTSFKLSVVLSFCFDF